MSRFVLLVVFLGTALLRASSFTTPFSLKPAFLGQEVSSQALHAKKKKKNKKKSSTTDPASAPAASVATVASTLEDADEPPTVAVTSDGVESGDAGEGKQFLDDVLVNPNT